MKRRARWGYARWVRRAATRIRKVRHSQVLVRASRSAGFGAAALADQEARPGGPHRLGQLAQVVGPVVTLAVDEERRCARYPAEVRGVDVLVDPGRADVVGQVAGEAVGIQAELARIPDQVVGGERALALQQLVVHLPEL